MSGLIPAGTAVVTGASAGIGAAYAEELARRGHDVVLVARRADVLQSLAGRLQAEHGVNAEVFAADLSDRADLRRLEARLAGDASISVLVNNAGVGAFQRFLASDIDGIEQMVALNITALTRLTRAVLPGFLRHDAGVVVNVASILAFWPWEEMGAYSASKSYVLAFTRALQKELEGTGVLAQVLAPPATHTPFWDQAGMPVRNLPEGLVMSTEDLVSAAVLGLERRELVVIPSLADAGDWERFDAAREGLVGKLMNGTVAPRYAVAAAAGA